MGAPSATVSTIPWPPPATTWWDIPPSATPGTTLARERPRRSLPPMPTPTTTTTDITWATAASAVSATAVSTGSATLATEASATPTQPATSLARGRLRLTQLSSSEAMLDPTTPVSDTLVSSPIPVSDTPVSDTQDIPTDPLDTLACTPMALASKLSFNIASPTMKWRYKRT